MVLNHLEINKKAMICILGDLLYTPIPQAELTVIFAFCHSAKSFVVLAAHWH